MNHLNKILICLISCFSTIAFANERLQIYGGMDAQLRHMAFKKGFGAKLFKETVPQGNIYIGAMLTDYLALECGYEATNKKTKPVTLGLGDDELGFVLTQNQIIANNEGHRFTSKIQGWHVDVLAFTTPVFSSLQFFAGIGIANKRILLIDSLVFTDELLISPENLTFVKRKTIPRFLAGVQKMLDEHWGVRVSVNWENTSRFKNLKPRENPAVIARASAKDSLNLGLGIFFKF